jgi:hypothetical protein
MTFYNIALITHIVGITIMAGTTFIDFVTFRVFLKALLVDTAKGVILEDYLYKLQRFIGIGMVIILISGVMMMAKLHEVWGAQTWFRVKMVVLLLIIINGLALRRIAGSKLKKVLAATLSDSSIDNAFKAVKQRFTIIQLMQCSYL